MLYNYIIYIYDSPIIYIYISIWPVAPAKFVWLPEADITQYTHQPTSNVEINMDEAPEMARHANAPPNALFSFSPLE